MKKSIVVSCSHSHGWPIARVTMSQRTSTLNVVMVIPHSTISICSMGSSARHFKWRCSCKTSPSNRRITWFRKSRQENECGELFGSPRSRTDRLFHVADQIEHFYRIRPEIRRELVLDRLADRREAALVDVLDNLDADLFELRLRLVFELERGCRLVLTDFVGCRLHPFLLFVVQARPDLVADE